MSVTTMDHRSDRAPAEPRPLARVRDLSVSFRRRGVETPAVEHVSFDVWPGHVHALVGESGSGKSVSARSLVGLNGRGARVRAAELSYRGKDVRGFGAHEWRAVRGRQIGFVLQDALQSLDPLRTIGREVAEALGTPTLRLDEKLRGQIAKLLRSVGIPDPETRIDQYSYQLSGGLRQRVLIATALARGPRLIIADEPTTALDTTIQKEIIELLRSAVREDVGLLLISHDLSLVAEVADTVSVLEHGRVVEEGDTARVLTRPVHPYTEKLLRAVPTADARGRRLSDAPGDPSGGEQPKPAPVALVDRPVILSGDGLRKVFVEPGGRSRVALDGVGFELRAGETLGVVGESGSGKTTLLRTIMGISEPDAGEVRLDDARWNPSIERERRPKRHEIQLITQDPLGSFDPRYTAWRIIQDGVRVSGLGGEQVSRRVAELGDAVGLSRDQLRGNPRELSGGQRQRVAIARALGAAPRILVCDEPVSALDVSVQAQVLDLLHDLRSAFGTAIVFVSHDLGVIYHVSDRVLVMKDGAVVEAGDVVGVYRSPQHPYTQRLLDAVPKLTSAQAHV